MNNTNQTFSPFDSISPIDSRYYGPNVALYERLHPYLSEQATIRYQMLVEVALLAELEASGIAPNGAAQAVEAALESITPEQVLQEEDRIKHNIRAIVNCIRAAIPEQYGSFVHLFATSNDIMDTARAVAMRDVTRKVLLPDIQALVECLIELAEEHADTVQMGRTHGQHAEPVTVGYWLANFISRIGERTEELIRISANLRGKVSGAVGGHNAFALADTADAASFEKRVLSRLGLQPSTDSTSTQIVHAEYLADFTHVLVSTFSIYANVADDFRNLMRPEIGEIRERKDLYHVGSSTMPHKINPKNFENVKSLWKAFMPRMMTLYMDQISEHQRDLTNSASLRFLPELVAAFDYSTIRLRGAIQATEFDLEAIARNVSQGGQYSVAEPLYIALALSGRDRPYETAQELLGRASEANMNLREYLSDSEEGKALMASLPEARRRLILNPEQYIGDSAVLTRSTCAAWRQRFRSADFGKRLERPKSPVRPREHAGALATTANGALHHG